MYKIGQRFHVKHIHPKTKHERFFNVRLVGITLWSSYLKLEATYHGVDRDPKGSTVDKIAFLDEDHGEILTKYLIVKDKDNITSDEMIDYMTMTRFTFVDTAGDDTPHPQDQTQPHQGQPHTR